MRNRKEKDKNLLNRLDKAREKRSRSIISLDVEYKLDEILEVGLSKMDGVRTTVSMIVNGNERREALNRHYGDFIVMELDDVLKTVREAYRESSMAVFHAGGNDRVLLTMSRRGSKNFDTASNGAAIMIHHTPSLKFLCQFYEIETCDPHEAGNDAHRTMLVAMRMMDEIIDARSLYHERKRMIDFKSSQDQCANETILN